jgi:hypothetical protein
MPGLDRALKGVIAGDNIVWRVDSVEDYREFAAPYAQAALRSGRPLVYFRFAPHAPLLDDNSGAEIHLLNPKEGFESFLGHIHAVIERAGRGAYYLFDSLSNLAVDWYSDSMLGNFFMLTCPYLYDMETVAYFALGRNQHSSDAIDPIDATTQILLDVYRYKGELYLHPIKVQHRYSPTMNMLYLALFPTRDANYLNHDFFLNASNRLTSLLKDAERWKDVIRVVDAADVSRAGHVVTLIADVREQKVLCFHCAASAIAKS